MSIDIDNIKNDFTNVSLNYRFFKFSTGDWNVKRYPFVIKSIRSHRNYSARNFYKPITRTISLNDFPTHD